MPCLSIGLVQHTKFRSLHWCSSLRRVLANAPPQLAPAFLPPDSADKPTAGGAPGSAAARAPELARQPSAAAGGSERAFEPIEVWWARHTKRCSARALALMPSDRSGRRIIQSGSGRRSFGSSEKTATDAGQAVIEAAKREPVAGADVQAASPATVPSKRSHDVQGASPPLETDASLRKAARAGNGPYLAPALAQTGSIPRSSSAEADPQGPSGPLGRVLPQAAEAIATALRDSVATGALSSDWADIERACGSLRPWQQRMTGVWLVRQLPHLCAPQLVPHLAFLSHVTLPSVLRHAAGTPPLAAGDAALGGGAQPTVLMQASGQALHSASAEARPIELSQQDVAWLVGVVSLLRELRADVPAAAAVERAAIAAMTSAAWTGSSGAACSAMSLARSVCAPLRALGAAKRLAHVLQDALAKGRGAECGVRVVQLAHATAGALTGDVQAAKFTAQADASWPPTDDDDAVTREAAIVTEALLPLLAAPLTGSGQVAALALKAVSALRGGATNPDSAAVPRIASRLVTTLMNLAARTPPLPRRALSAVVPTLLDAFDCIVTDLPQPGPTVALIGAISDAISSTSDAEADGAASAAALIPAATTRGLIDTHVAAALCIRRYDAGQPVSHLVIAALLGDPSAPRPAPLATARHLLPAGTACALAAAQRHLPQSALTVFFGTSGAKRSLLPDAMSAPGPAGRRARIAADAALACAATRLALLDADGAVPMHGSHLDGTTKQTGVAPRWAAAVALHAGHVVRMTELAAPNWRERSECLLMRVCVAVPERADRLIAAASAQAAAAAPAAPAPAASDAVMAVAATMAAAATQRAAAAPALVGATAAAPQGPALARALFAAVGKYMPHPTESSPSPSAETSTPSEPRLPPRSGEMSSGGARARSQFAELYLHLLCRMDTATWRDRAEVLVSHIEAIAGVSCAPVPSGGDRGANTAFCGHEGALALRLDLIMPLLPLIYSARGAAADRKTRARLAHALARLLAHDAMAQLSTTRESEARRLTERMLTVLQALTSDEWPQWIMCHQTRGKLQAVGPLPEPGALVDTLRSAAAGDAIAALNQVAAAADTALLRACAWHMGAPQTQSSAGHLAVTPAQTADANKTAPYGAAVFEDKVPTREARDRERDTSARAHAVAASSDLPRAGPQAVKLKRVTVAAPRFVQLAVARAS